jgi:hypothetical protein
MALIFPLRQVTAGLKHRAIEPVFVRCVRYMNLLWALQRISRTLGSYVEA